MAWDKEWTDGEYTEEDIKILGETLVKVIQDSNGEFTGTIYDIAKLAGYHTTKDGEVENYGGIYRAMQEVKKQYRIIAKNKGRKGNTYLLENKIKATKMKNNKLLDSESAREIIATLRNMINLIDLDNITEDEAKGIIKLFKTILK